MSMLSYVIDRLRAEETVLTVVCRETGLKPSWLWQLKDGRIPDPSVRKIQSLHDYFRRKDAEKVSPADTAVQEKEAA